MACGLVALTRLAEWQGMTWLTEPALVARR